MPRLHVGTVGWSYGFWVGNFYPSGLKQDQFLSQYCKSFDTVEVDMTFYRIPTRTMVERWKEQTPGDFLFSAKFPKKITQDKKLVDVEADTRVFLDRMSLLVKKGGPLLIQLSYDFKPDELPKLIEFLNGLPQHDRFALEVKNRKMLGEGLYSILRDRGVALAMVDHPFMPKLDTLTADFAYLRLEGDKRKIKGTTGAVEVARNQDTREWAEKARKLLDQGVDVFIYVNKFYSGHSPTDALLMLRLLESKE